MGTDTQILWVTVTVQLVPPASVTQSTLGTPWQVIVAVPATATGVSISGAATSTHCVPTFVHPLGGQPFSG